jgi:MFS superfamily sulfate permease-like transporter
MLRARRNRPSQGSSRALGTDRANWTRWLPGLLILRQYQVAWLPQDIVAGLVLTTILVPVGIAYAVASGVPGIYGLYATIVPLLAYALFGPSRILVLGPDSSLAAIILSVVLPLSGGDPAKAIALASMMAIVSGTVCILAGVARLGFITELLSKPIRYGYMNGIALTVLISQLPKLLGFSIESDGPLYTLWRIGAAILGGATNWTAFAIGGGTLAVILLLKGIKRMPAILIAVVGATAVVGVLDLAVRADVSVLGPLPQGLPQFVIPWITMEDIAPVLIGSRASMPREPRRPWILTRRWSVSEPPIWRQGSSKGFRSAAARRGRPSPKRRAPEHS